MDSEQLLQLLEKTLVNDNQVLQEAGLEILRIIEETSTIYSLFNILSTYQDTRSVSLAYLYLYKCIKVQWNTLDIGNRAMIQYNLLEILQSMPSYPFRQILNIFLDIIYPQQITFTDFLKWLENFDQNVDSTHYKLLIMDFIFYKLPDDFIINSAENIIQQISYFLNQTKIVIDERIKINHLYAHIINTLTSSNKIEETDLENHISNIFNNILPFLQEFNSLQFDSQLVLAGTIGSLISFHSNLINNPDYSGIVESILSNEDVPPQIKFTIYQYLLHCIPYQDSSNLQSIISDIFRLSIEMADSDNVKSYISECVKTASYFPSLYGFFIENIILCFETDDLSFYLTGLRFMIECYSSFSKLDNEIETIFVNLFREKILNHINSPEEYDFNLQTTSLSFIELLFEQTGDIEILENVIWMAFSGDEELEVKFSETIAEICQTEFDVSNLLELMLTRVSVDSLDDYLINDITNLVYRSEIIKEETAAAILEIIEFVIGQENSFESILMLSGAILCKLPGLNERIVPLIYNSIIMILKQIKQDEKSDISLFTTLFQFMSRFLEKFPNDEDNFLLNSDISNYLSEFCQTHFTTPSLEVFFIPIKFFYVSKTKSFDLLGDLMNDIFHAISVKNEDLVIAVVPVLPEISVYLHHEDILRLVQELLSFEVNNDDKNGFYLLSSVIRILNPLQNNEDFCDFDQIIDSYIGSFIINPSFNIFIHVLDLLKFGLIRGREESFLLLQSLTANVLNQAPSACYDSYLGLLIDFVETGNIPENFFEFIANVYSFIHEKIPIDCYQNFCYLTNLFLSNYPDTLSIFEGYVLMTVSWVGNSNLDADSNIYSLISTYCTFSENLEFEKLALQSFPPHDLTEVNRMMQNFMHFRYNNDLINILLQGCNSLIENKEEIGEDLDEELFTQFVQFCQSIRSG